MSEKTVETQKSTFPASRSVPDVIIREYIFEQWRALERITTSTMMSLQSCIKTSRQRTQSYVTRLDRSQKLGSAFSRNRTCSSRWSIVLWGREKEVCEKGCQKMREERMFKPEPSIQPLIKLSEPRKHRTSRPRAGRVTTSKNADRFVAETLQEVLKNYLILLDVTERLNFRHRHGTVE